MSAVFIIRLIARLFIATGTMVAAPGAAIYRIGARLNEWSHSAAIDKRVDDLFGKDRH